MTPAEFVELCFQLRQLGANEVTAHEYGAKFTGHALPALPAPPPEDEPKLTPDQAREAQYARDLGRAYKPTKPE